MKIFTYVLLLFSCLFLTSCFEILEEVTLNENGSGEFEFTANLSQSKTKLKSIMLMEKVNGYKVPSQKEVKDEIDKICALAKNTKGITGVKKTIDFENFIFSFSCKFDSVETLNKVVKNIRLSKKVNNSNHDNQYSYNRQSKTFQRNFNNSLKAEFSKLKAEDKKVVKDANYIAIYRFKKEVKSVSNSKTKTSPNKKATMLKVKIVDVINKKASIKNTVKLK